MGGKHRIMDRLVVINHLGKLGGSAFDDRIAVEFSPSELEHLMHRFKGLALETRDYSDQGNMREFAERFQRAHMVWRDARDAKNKKDR